MKLSIYSACAVLLTLLPLATAALPSIPNWQEWKAIHAREYPSMAEEAHRMAIFLKNTELVVEHNMLYNNGNVSHYLGLNKFADISNKEFKERMGMVPRENGNPFVSQSEAEVFVATGVAIPAAVDWREKGLVTPVKNQGSCGSCWAFSTIVSAEGQHAKKTGKLVSLSEQNLVDCVTKTNGCCDGCDGGLMVDAFEYVVKKQGGKIDTEASYGYQGVAGKCKFNANTAGATIKGNVVVKQGDEKGLKEAVATVGPVSIGVDANLGWQFYLGGVFKPTPFIGCSSSPKKMDHGVAIVGYGEGYWIVRNSWGKGWGEKGYIRLAADVNACGLANAATFPKV